jgi:hypothetical protein
MKQSGVRRFFYHAGSAFGVIGMLLLMGSFVVWLIGLETIVTFYENNRPLVFCALAGVVLIALGVFFSTVVGGGDLLATRPGTDTVQGASSTDRGAPAEEGVRCGKCEAVNDLDAKFCDQCGTTLAGGPGETAYRAAR